MKNKSNSFKPGVTYIPSSAKVFDQKEIKNAIKVARDGWWTEGEYAKLFEASFRKFLNCRYVSLVNSGSSANLVALYSLTAKVFGEKRLKINDEFICTQVSFPTTINPGIMFGLKPVFVDVEADTLNVNASLIEKAITKKTKLIMLAHTLGKPFDLEKIMYLVNKYDLWLIEDCCDALGSKYDNKLLSSFGHLATFSFYPAHQMTMGEGGAVVTNSSLIHRSVRQFRDWGRDCWCDPGHDNTCNRRYQWKLGELPFGYDHKFIYSQIGFNLKLTDFQAAIGLAQLEKLPKFIKKRKTNFQKLFNFFGKYEKFFTLVRIDKREDPCWFGFPLIVKTNAPFTRNEFTQYLEKNKIGTRNVFAGNILKHPAYLKLKCRIVGGSKNADNIMNNAFWLGVYPGIDTQRINYMQKIVETFLKPYL